MNKHHNYKNKQPINKRPVSFLKLISFFIAFYSISLSADDLKEWKKGFMWSGYSYNAGVFSYGRSREEAIENWISSVSHDEYRHASYIYNVRFSHIVNNIVPVYVYLATRRIFNGEPFTIDIQFSKSACSNYRVGTIQQEYCPSEQYNLVIPSLYSLCGEKEGNPCNPSTGAKIQIFTDYKSSNGQELTLKRTYLSLTRTTTQLALGWQHNYSATMNPKQLVSSIPTVISIIARKNSEGLQQSSHYSTTEEACLNGWQEIKNKAFRGFLAAEQVQYAGDNLCQVVKGEQVVATLAIQSANGTSVGTPLMAPTHRIIRSDSSQYFFQQQGTEWKDWQHPETSLVAQGTQWLFTDAGNNQELYDEQGRLIKITDRQGQVTLLQHDLTSAEGGDDKAETLDKVTDPFGRTLIFNYQT